MAAEEAEGITAAVAAVAADAAISTTVPAPAAEGAADHRSSSIPLPTCEELEAAESLATASSSSLGRPTKVFALRFY
jgi:hypothetical protein